MKELTSVAKAEGHQRVAGNDRGVLPGGHFIDAEARAGCESQM